MHVLNDKLGTLFGRLDTTSHWLAPDSNRQLATGFEIIGPDTPGFGTRFISLYLSLLPLIAITAVHIGHAVTEGNWKLPLIYLAIQLPLILSGPGRPSPGFWLRQIFPHNQRQLRS